MEKPAVVINDILTWKSEHYELVRSTLNHHFQEDVDYREYVIREKSSGLFFKATALPMQREIAFSAFKQVFPRILKQIEFSSLNEADGVALDWVEKQMQACREIFKPEKIAGAVEETKEIE